MSVPSLDGSGVRPAARADVGTQRGGIHGKDDLVVQVNGHGGNGSGNGTRVRDRLCQLIRQHKLDAELVKSYAIDFCGTKTLREASREQVESFVTHLADWAGKDRNALLCQLNSFQRPQGAVTGPQAGAA